MALRQLLVYSFDPSILAENIFSDHDLSFSQVFTLRELSEHSERYDSHCLFFIDDENQFEILSQNPELISSAQFSIFLMNKNEAWAKKGFALGAKDVFTDLDCFLQKAYLYRSLEPIGTRKKFPQIKLDRNLATHTGLKKTAELTLTELKIFEQLLYSQNTVSKSDILEQIWKGVRVTDKVLDVHLYNLRKKIEPLNLRVEYIAQQGYLLSLKE